MLTKEVFEQRVADLTKAVEKAAADHSCLLEEVQKSIATHNALVGRLEEAKFFAAEVEKFLEAVVPDNAASTAN